MMPSLWGMFVYQEQTSIVTRNESRLIDGCTDFCILYHGPLGGIRHLKPVKWIPHVIPFSSLDNAYCFDINIFVF